MVANWLRWLSFWNSDRTAGLKYRPRVKDKFRARVERLESRETPSFAGGVTAAGGDVNGDGFVDIVSGQGPGGSSQVSVVSGRDGSVLRTITAFDGSFTGGVNVATGDVDNDGRADIIVGAGRGDAPRVQVFSGATGAILRDFMAYDVKFRGGVSVAAGNFDDDGRADIVTGAGPGGGPHVVVHSGADNKILRSFFAFDDPGSQGRRFRGGVSVAAGNFDGTGQDEIVAGAGPGGLPIVQVFTGTGVTMFESKALFAYDPNFRGGVCVAMGDVNNDGRDDVITGAGPGGSPHVLAYNATDNGILRTFHAFDPLFGGGVFVGTPSDINADGSADILTGAGAGGGPHVKAFNGGNSTLLTSFNAFDPASRPGPFAVASDAVAPTIDITSPTGEPLLSTNATIVGTVQDNKAVTSLTAQIDGGTAVPVTFSGGQFTFTTTLGTTGSDDGPHTVTFTARDAAGNSTNDAFTFTLTTSVASPTFDLAVESDSGVVGDRITSNNPVTLLGTTSPNVTVLLVGPGTTVVADAQGKFRFDNVNLTAGQNSLTVRATDNLGNSRETTQTFTLNNAPSITAPIQNVTVTSGAPATVLDLSNNFGDVNIVNTLVRVGTNQGDINFELFDARTPLTVANFLNYLSRGDFNGTIFHRSVPNFVVQAGGFQFNRDPGRLDEIRTDPPVPNEPGISNTRGTLAMAKLGGDPNSATNQFFFNLNDNSQNLDNQNGGFTVFGQITDPAGLAVIDQISEIPTQDQGGSFTQIPLVDYSGTNFPVDARPRNFVTVNTATVTRSSDRISFSVVANSNPSLVTTTVVGNKLTLNYAAAQTGTATITVRATDLDGLTIDSTFTVTVN